MKKKIKGGTINIILIISFMILFWAFCYFSFELFHWPRKVYVIIILVLIPVCWSQPLLFLMGKKTIGDIIADKINKKYIDKDTDSK